MAMTNSSLVLIHQKTQQRYPLKTEFVIGRSTGDLVFDQDPILSSKHCLIRATESGFAIYDLKSRTGVYINGAQLLQGRACLLKSGAQITIGDQTFVVKDETADAAATTWRLFLPAILLAVLATGSLSFIKPPRASEAQAPTNSKISRLDIIDSEMREAVLRLEALKNPQPGQLPTEKEKLSVLKNDLLPRFLNLYSQLQSLPATGPQFEPKRRLANIYLSEVTAMTKFFESKDLRFEREAEDFARQARFLREELTRAPASQ